MTDIQTMQIGDLCVCLLATPGHTSDHCAYVVTHVTPDSTKTPFLFCGDTLFSAGCGRLLGGTAQELFDSLYMLMSLPNETLLFCGHEYTVKNLEFAKMLEPDNEAIQHKLEVCKQIILKSEFTVGGHLYDERLFNPFIRCFGAGREAKEYYQKITGETDTVRVFGKLRALKD